MVVELLTLSVRPDVRAAWLAADESNWTAFLRRQDGFVRKEVWWSRDDPASVRVVVWWRSMEQWTSISQAALDAVVAEMGELEHHAVCDAFDVVAAT